MAADTVSTWVVLSGTGANTTANITLAGSVITPQFALRTNGAPVESTNPLYVNPTPVIYSSAITIAATIGTTSAAIISAGGAPTGRLDLFNNTASGGGTLWVNPSGGTAVVGSGIPIYAGGSYTWLDGIAVAPTGISDNGTLNLSGAGGY
jgi:hypothetical protein